MSIGNDYEAYCFRCGHKAEDNEYSCTKCGYKVLVLGEDGKDYLRTPKGISCICGSTELRSKMHMSFDKYHKSVYQCDNCNHCITMDTESDNYIY